MIPTCVLFGRPNVGKSTLFNKLTHTSDALVADYPRLTRDRKYGQAEWKGYKFVIVDTIGIDGTENGIEINMAAQSLVAIQEADIILFIVDGQDGLLIADQKITKYINRYKKNIILIVNKVDKYYCINSIIAEFRSLGIDTIIPISALHGYGINNLLKLILSLSKNSNLSFLKLNEKNKSALDSNINNKNKMLISNKSDYFSLQSLPIKLSVVGRPNVGKSMLINCLLGEERVLVYNIPGTTRDSIYINMIHGKRKYILIDTAGIRKRNKIVETIEKFSVIKTLRAIEDSHVVLLMIDASEGISDQDLSLLNLILNSGRSLVIVVNKWDKISIDMRDKVKNTLNYRLNFINFVRIHFISALQGKGISNLFESVNEAYQCATKHINTALITRIVQMAIRENRPPLVYGKPIKPKYAHIGGYNPPIIVIHGNRVKNLPNNYKRYLVKYFRNALGIVGTPIRLRLNESVNPFIKS